MSNELNRFLDLYGAVARATNEWVAAAPAELLDWIPDDGPDSEFIDGRGRLSIKTFYIHLVVGDHVQAPQLSSCADGATIAFSDQAVTDRLAASGNLVEDAMKLHDEDMAHFRAITDAQMEKTIYRGKTEWTVAAYLWTIYSHRAFHIGNMDIYLRTSHIAPPAYYPAIQRPA